MQNLKSVENNELVRLENVSKYFRVGRNKTLKAVDGVSLSINRGETLGLVGESGCGKSTLGRTIIHIHESSGGEIWYQGKDITHVSRNERRNLADHMQMIFQDPYASLNPRMTVGDIIAEGWDIRRKYSAAQKREEIHKLLHLVGLNEEHANRFPHEFSGGQRQRIGIARALSMDPKFIICDEPISALDVSIQAQIMNLMIDLQKRLGLTYLFIAHDLSMVKHISDSIAVMYLGHVMEYAESQELYENPMHPYTQALFSAIPVADPIIEKQRVHGAIEGDVQSPINPSTGCRFASRCPRAVNRCHIETPQLREFADGHYAACHLLE